MHQTSIESRRRGTFLGLAVGDALGAAVEFMPPGSFEPVTDYRDGGPHGLEPGEWTDDTSMALALADSIAQSGWSLDDQARRYVQWWRQGEYSVNGRCFDIGITTHTALARFERSGDARSSGDPSERASANGSIMRLALVPIRYVHLFPERIDELARLPAESSLPTHASPQCLSACRYLALVLTGLMHGLPREAVLSPDWAAPVPERSTIVTSAAQATSATRMPSGYACRARVAHGLTGSKQRPISRLAACFAGRGSWSRAARASSARRWRAGSWTRTTSSRSTTSTGTPSRAPTWRRTRASASFRRTSSTPTS
jgi:ADP-ribosylglycohydrolase